MAHYIVIITCYLEQYGWKKFSILGKKTDVDCVLFSLVGSWFHALAYRIEDRDEVAATEVEEWHPYGTNVCSWWERFTSLNPSGRSDFISGLCKTLVYCSDRSEQFAWIAVSDLKILPRNGSVPDYSQRSEPWAVWAKLSECFHELEQAYRLCRSRQLFTGLEGTEG